MGFYINVTAKDNCLGQINDLWGKRFSGWLIYTKPIIQDEIDYIAKDDKQKHLYWIDSVEKWNKAFPVYAERRGQIFLRAYGYSDKRARQFIKQNSELIKKVKWLLDNRLLFESITGLQDAAYALAMNIPFDAWEDGKAVTYHRDNFDELPCKPENRVYQVCVKHNKPELWKYFVDWCNSPCWETWAVLRHHTTPIGGWTKTVWQNAEAIAEARDGVSYGLAGRYRDGLFPPETDVVKAILDHQEEGGVIKQLNNL